MMKISVKLRIALEHIERMEAEGIPEQLRDKMLADVGRLMRSFGIKEPVGSKAKTSSAKTKVGEVKKAKSPEGTMSMGAIGSSLGFKFPTYAPVRKALIDAGMISLGNPVTFTDKGKTYGRIYTGDDGGMWPVFYVDKLPELLSKIGLEKSK